MDGLVVPGGPLGVTPFHMPYEATITLSHETYIRVVYETCRRLLSMEQNVHDCKLA